MTKICKNKKSWALSNLLKATALLGFMLTNSQPALAKASPGGSALSNAVIQALFSSPKFNSPALSNFEKKSIRCAVLIRAKMGQTSCVNVNQVVLDNEETWKVRVEKFQAAKRSLTASERDNALQPYVLTWDGSSESCKTYNLRKPALDTYESCMNGEIAAFSAKLGKFDQGNVDSLYRELNDSPATGKGQ